jgi:hypothetical protein
LLWDLVKLDRPLERADGIGKARVFAGALDTPLFEGFRQIGRTSARGLDMSHLYGWGYSLGTGRERPLVETVEDRGRLKFFPSSFRGRTKDFVVWRIPTFPREGHRIVVWSDWAAQPREIDARQVVCDKDGLVWTLPLLGGVAAGAIAHNGLRLGSWFGAEAVATIGNVSALERHFAILRWLKVPVLSNAIVRAVREGICRDPAAFIRGWLDKGALPRGLVHGNGEDGLESVVREFFWYYSERSVSKVEALVAAFPAASYRNESGIEVFTSVLAGLSDEYPSIAYSLARVRVGGEYRRALRPVVEGLVFQPEPMPLAQAVRSASDRCAKLVGAAERQLEDAVVAFVACLDGRGNPTQAQNFYLRRLGETVNGRRFLSAALLLRLLEGRVP